VENQPGNTRLFRYDGVSLALDPGGELISEALSQQFGDLGVHVQARGLTSIGKGNLLYLALSLHRFHHSSTPLSQVLGRLYLFSLFLLQFFNIGNSVS
jgi:hypothetical protein